MSTDKTPQQLYQELKEYPSMIEGYEPYQIEAVIRHSINVEKVLIEKLDQLMVNSQYIKGEYDSAREYWLNNSEVGKKIKQEQKFREEKELYLDVGNLKTSVQDIVKQFDEMANGQERKTKKGNRGRKKDRTAPQEPINKKVAELIKSKSETNSKGRKKEFIKKNGEPKPTTIRDFIESEHPELMGKISSRRLFDRVKTAIEEMK